MRILCVGGSNQKPFLRRFRARVARRARPLVNRATSNSVEALRPARHQRLSARLFRLAPGVKLASVGPEGAFGHEDTRSSGMGGRATPYR